MTLDEFDAVVERRLGLTRDTLVIKGREYVRGDDRLSNFKLESQYNRLPVVVNVLSKLSKHLVSVADMCHDEVTGTVYTKAMWDEKIGDCVNYLVLLEAVLEEGRR